MKVSVTVFAQGWFGGKKMKAAIGFDKVVEILHKFQAPADVSTSVKRCPDWHQNKVPPGGPASGKALISSPGPNPKALA